MSHLPTEAIEALARAPEAPPEGHLAACPACARKLGDARGRQALLAGLRPVTLSDAAFRRVQARLDEAVAEGIPGIPAWQRLGWLPVVLALGVAAVVVWRQPAPPVVARAPEPRPPARVEALTVLRVPGDARRRSGAAPWGLLTAGDRLEPGDAVAGTGLLLSPAAEVPWALALSGAASVGRAATLDLERGELRVRAAGPALEVRAGELGLRATEALFSVNRAAAEVDVAVAEGSVELTDGFGAVRTLRAPAGLRWTAGTPLAAATAGPPVAVAAPVVPARPWARLDATGLPAGTRLSLDGAALGEAPFSAMVTEGRRRLGVAPPGGPLRESWVALVGPYTVGPVAAPVPAPEAAEPDPAAVARAQEALRAAIPRLAVCYERWLKANPQASATVELHLTVAASGRVRQAGVVGGGLPAASADCLARSARKLVLPALGAEVELEVPLRLTTTRP